MAPALEVCGVSKRYVRGIHRGGTQLLSRTVLQWGRGLLRGGGSLGSLGGEPFWALQDVSFAVEQGQVVGIIGRNGSGKSTLLKIIAQITAPTTGELRIRGRVGTLLEVGTGFHPELTGRENVFLNGAILGMTRAEISRKFDEIVAFSGVEDFIDTPVKRYSSGMQTRLAFSVAAHLEPEILIVDEVLAVGDAEFQKKCLGKMNEVSKEGRTVFFVSHNMSAVDQLCNRVIWLDRGKLVLDTLDTYEAAAQYFVGLGNSVACSEINRSNAPLLETEFFTLESFRLIDGVGRTIDSAVPADFAVAVEIKLDIKRIHSALSIGYAVFNEAGQQVYWSLFFDEDENKSAELKVGTVVLTCPIPTRFLNQGQYRFDLMTSLHFIKWFTPPAETPYSVFLRVEGGMSDSAFWQYHRPGVVAPVLPWKVSVSS